MGLLEAVLEARDDLYRLGYYGPFLVLLSPELCATVDDATRRRLLSVEGVSRVEQDSTLLPTHLRLTQVTDGGRSVTRETG